MATIKIMQIFQNVDLRAGENGLGNLLAGKNMNIENLPDGYVYLFVNKRRNIVKVLGNSGIFCEKLKDKQTWDFKLRKDQLLGLIGRAFNIELTCSNKLYSEGKEQKLKLVKRG